MQGNVQEEVAVVLLGVDEPAADIRVIDPEHKRSNRMRVQSTPHEVLALTSRGWTRAQTLHADAMARSGGDGGGCQTKRS